MCRPLTALGAFRVIEEHVREAAALAEALGDRPRLGEVYVRWCLVHRQAAAYQAAIEAGQQALTIAVDLGDRRLEGVSTHRIAQAYWMVGDAVRAADLLRQSVETAACAANPDLALAARRRWLALALSSLGQFDEAIAQAEAAVCLAEASGRVWPRIEAHATLGRIFLTQGDFRHAIACLEQSVTLARTWNIMDWGAWPPRVWGRPTRAWGGSPRPCR